MYRVYPRVRAGFLMEPLVEVRRHGRNSYVNLLQKLETEPRILRSLVGEPFTTEQQAILRRSVGRAWCSLGWHHFHQGSLLRSAAAYLRALAYPGRRVSALKHLLALPAAPLITRRRKRAAGSPVTNW